MLEKWGGQSVNLTQSVRWGRGRTARYEALERSGLEVGILESQAMKLRSPGKTAEEAQMSVQG